MLKLIYSLSEKQITLKFDKKNNFWTREFLLALCISLLMHLLFYGVVHVRFSLPQADFILKPSRVFAEVQINSEALKPPQVDEFGFLQNQLMRPQKTVFFEQGQLLRSSAPLALLEEAPFSPQYQFENYPIKPEDSEIFIPSLEAFKVAEPIRMVASSHLMDRLYIPKVKAKKLSIAETETLFCLFNVEFEDRTGKLFVSELLTPTGYAKYDQYALQILNKLRMKPEKGRFSTKGEIQIFIEANKRDLHD